MARIMEQPSLKSLLGEKEDGAIMRVAIIILLAYWIDGDNENETLEDVPFIDDHWIYGDNENKTLEDVPSIDDQGGSEDMGSCINLDESIIYDLVDHTRIEEIACEVESGSGLAIILDELLKSVLQPRASLHEDCKANFKIVNMAWEDNQLISLLLKQQRVIHKIDRYCDVSSQQLRETLTPLIKDHLSMRDILRESEASSVRGALTILIGYLSAKDMILGFDDVMGRGGSVGIKTVRYSYSQDDMKVEPTYTSEGRGFVELSSYTLDALMPDPSLINQLLHDASFKDVAQQIQCEPRAVKFADFVLDCLAYSSDEQFIASHDLNNMFEFWQHPSLMHLRRALKKSPRLSLFNLFKQLSDGAEMLRLKERLDRIREDNFWKTIDIDKSDFSLRMRLALSILIGYWSAGDVTRLVMPILFYQLENPSKAHLLEDLRDVEIICYWADSNHDLEGLKNVLSSKYAKDSPEFERRVVEIEHHQNLKVAEAVVRGYDNTEAQITALLKGDSCILMLFSWFSKTWGMLSDACA
ncbi:hypothetical protein PHJA_002007300 [Phtheirospermum japonicum]|uniref:Uncharacterized protein n=1 Tax=Phtheirospermum japonicum TaxID=374723 RepID=A0A830CRD3_9LAMI|nr:hypothetical protein PHJA_002007300 [Phtheirospermum japonicum]